MKALQVRPWISLALMALGTGGFLAAPVAALTGAPVVVVPIHGTVDDGMAHLVERSVAQANDEKAAAVVLDVDSPGGLVDPAFRIRDALFSAREPVIAYVDGRAYSAAALISLAADRILMKPGSSIGAAEPIPATAKMVSALRGEFESTAQRNHRSAQIAGAMVDKNVDLPAYKRTGAILTLNTDDAVRAQIADATAPSLDAALAQSNLGGAPRSVEEYTLGEELARFATSPQISALLLTLGMLGLLIEMQTLHGIAGAVGIGALALFFGTHVYAGFSNPLVLLLAVIGILGILWELHIVPGHVLPGAVGAICLLLAALFAFGLPFFFVAIETIATAIVLTVICFTLAARKLPENAWARRLALGAAQGSDYVTSADRTGLIGRTGTAVSYLRPAGIAAIEGQRVDVLTAGEFIPQGTPVRVVRVEGARVFVEAVSLPSYQLRSQP
ncbi:MAG TPA: NfeD family protein [Candidatus Tumulicola sp.]|jgi:membrane-bound serine protease (ClpP class)